jgi:hypothetical protein
VIGAVCRKSTLHRISVPERWGNISSVDSLSASLQVANLDDEDYMALSEGCAEISRRCTHGRTVAFLADANEFSILVGVVFGEGGGRAQEQEASQYLHAERLPSKVV